jgi:hypothetical protein
MLPGSSLASDRLGATGTTLGKQLTKARGAVRLFFSAIKDDFQMSSLMKNDFRYVFTCWQIFGRLADSRSAGKRSTPYAKVRF